MKNSCRKYGPKASLGPLLILTNNPEQPLHARKFFLNKVI